MSKQKLNRERKRLQKKLDRAAAFLTEHKREALIEIVQSKVSSEYQKQRAEQLLKKLDKRGEDKIQRSKDLDALLEAYEKKSIALVPAPAPAPAPAPDPAQAEPEIPAAPVMDEAAKAARIKVLEVEMKRIDFERSECAKLRMKLTDEQWERNWALFHEYHQLTDPPKPEPTPEEVEQIRKRKIFEAAQEKLIERIKAENMRAAGEWPTGRPDIQRPIAIER